MGCYACRKKNTPQNSQITKHYTYYIVMLYVHHYEYLCNLQFIQCACTCTLQSIQISNRIFAVAKFCVQFILPLENALIKFVCSFKNKKKKKYIQTKTIYLCTKHKKQTKWHHIVLWLQLQMVYYSEYYILKRLCIHIYIICIYITYNILTFVSMNRMQNCKRVIKKVKHSKHNTHARHIPFHNSHTLIWYYNIYIYFLLQRIHPKHTIIMLK